MIRGVWSRDTVGWVIVTALLPPVAVQLLAQGAPAALRIAFALVVIGGWQFVFRWAGGVPMSPTAALTAVAVAVLAPGEMALWQLMLAVSFGSVLGELVFGGWGRNVLSPAVVTLAFVFVSFPGVRQEPAGPAMALACVPAALLLLATGILSWRVLAGALAALAALAGDPGAVAAAGGIAFGLVFLVGDPVSSPSTAAGRWLHGLLAGALIGHLGHSYGAVGAPQATVFAALLASIFAPLLDQAVIAARALRRRPRHG